MIKFTRLALAAFLAASVGLTAACSAETKSSPESELFVPVTNSKLALYSEYVLEQTEESMDSITWSSSNASVVEVKDGELFAKKTGTATVTATWNGEKQTQKITVYDDGARPAISTEDLPLILGSAFTVESELSFNGIEYEGATFTYASDNASCVSVNGATLTANANGSATITVSASYRGIENIATDTFTCTVNADEGIVTSPRYDLHPVAQVNDQTFEKEVILEADVYIGATLVEKATIAWTVDNAEIAEIRDGNVLSAKALGTTALRGVYENDGKILKTLPIPVTVTPATIITQKNILMDKGNPTASFSSTEIYGDSTPIVSMGLNGSTFELQENNNIATADFATGEFRATFYSAEGKVGVETNLIVADFVIQTEEDFRKISNYTGDDNQSVYIALGADVELDSDTPYEPVSGTFYGTLNGLGHKVSGMTITKGNKGLFQLINGCTIKNIAFTNARITGPDGAGIGIIAYQVNGSSKLDNVYISVSFAGYGSTESGGVVGLIRQGTLTIKNSIIVATDLSTFSNGYASGAVAGRNTASLVMENSYVISDGTICGTKPGSNNTAYDSLNQLECIYSSGDEFEKMRKAEYSPIDLSGFNSFWNLNQQIPSF